MIGQALKDLPRSVLRLFCGFFVGREGREWEGMCEAGRWFWGYFRRMKLSGHTICWCHAGYRKPCPPSARWRGYWKSARGMLQLWVALPVLLLSVTHSAAAFVKWLAPSHRSPVFSLAATWQPWHTKPSPWKAAPPPWHRCGTAGLGAAGRPRKDPSGLCQPSRVTTGGNTSPQAEEPTARLSRGRNRLGKAGIAVHSCAFRKGLLCLILQKHNTPQGQLLQTQSNTLSSPFLLNVLRVNIWAFNLLVDFWWFPLVVMWEDKELGENWICLLPLTTYISQVVSIAFLAKAQRLTTVNVLFQINENSFYWSPRQCLTP